jgi:hypothetical protein
MLDFFIAPSKEEVNSISGVVKERVYIDTCASTRIFVVTPNGEIYLDAVEVLKRPGLTDKGSSMMVHRLGQTKHWREISVCDRARKSIILADKLDSRGYKVIVEDGQVGIFRDSKLLITCAYDNGMLWFTLRTFLSSSLHQSKIKALSTCCHKLRRPIYLSVYLMAQTPGRLTALRCAQDINDQFLSERRESNNYFVSQRNAHDMNGAGADVVNHCQTVLVIMMVEEIL